MILADIKLMKHVFLNFIKNALFSTEKAGKGEITFSLKKGQYMDTIFIRDEGIGIPIAIQKKIFDPFFSTYDHGMGMGLAFCRNIIRSLGGDVSVVSEEREFTEFCLTIPSCDNASKIDYGIW